MLRRVTRVARNVLLAVGLLCIAWFPVSFYLWASVYLPLQHRMHLDIGCVDGRIELVFISFDPPFEGTFRAEAGRYATKPADRPLLWMFLKPGYAALKSRFIDTRIVQRTLTIPLWLLATLCLAWPVTSFLIARRRRGRGFEVEMSTLD